MWSTECLPQAQFTDELCALFAQVFSKPITASWWRWKYHDAALLGRINIVLRGVDGSICGHAGAVIWPGVYQGQTIPIAQVCDVMLAPQQRGNAGPRGAYATLMKALIQALQQQVSDGLHYGFPGERPFRLGERLGFYRGTGLIQAWRLPAQKQWWQRWRWSRLDWQAPCLDRLWQDDRPKTRCMLRRDARYLAWRYARHPEHRYQLLGLRDRFKLTGWVIVRTEGTVLHCIDRLVDETALHTLWPLLADRAYTEGLAAVELWAEDTATLPTTAVAHSTGMMGVVMPSSALPLRECHPFWQPGDTDVY